MRVFRAVNDVVYESVRQTLDGAYGYPNESTKTVTSITPASMAEHDAQGRVYLISSDAECRYDAVASLLPQLLSSGLAEEVDWETYLQEVPHSTLP